MLIPAINTKGKFTFDTPFDTILNINEEFTVSSVRNLIEIRDSQEDPYTTIYQLYGLTQNDFKNDVDNNIPIVTLNNSGGKYYYVPANKITSIPIVDGVKYRDMILAISLGSIPIDLDLTLAKDTIKQILYDTVGIDSTVEEVPSSAIILVDNNKHDAYMGIINNKKSIVKSYRTLYLEELNKNNELTNLVNDLETYIENLP
jgi:hypothetical protein